MNKKINLNIYTSQSLKDFVALYRYRCIVYINWSTHLFYSSTANVEEVMLIRVVSRWLYIPAWDSRCSATEIRIIIRDIEMSVFSTLRTFTSKYPPRPPYILNFLWFSISLINLLRILFNIKDYIQYVLCVKVKSQCFITFFFKWHFHIIICNCNIVFLNGAYAVLFNRKDEIHHTEQI